MCLYAFMCLRQRLGECVRACIYDRDELLDE